MPFDRCKTSRREVSTIKIVDHQINNAGGDRGPPLHRNPNRMILHFRIAVAFSPSPAATEERFFF